VLLLLLGLSMVGAGTGEPVATVRSFHEALAAGDPARALELLDPAVVIFEQGGAEASRDEYASQHLADDIEFSRATSSKVLDQRTHVKGKTAWVLTTSETNGSFRDKDVASRGVETMVLEKSGGNWRIVHIHWSSHRKP
jgi:ketosteroid isomerase-like protein